MEKRYIKYIDNKAVISPANKIVIITETSQIFNPTEEMIFNDGWSEYKNEEAPVVEESIVSAKKKKINEIKHYDSSEIVNSFTYNGQNMWLDKATRVGLMLRIESEIATGKNTTSLWHNENEYVLDIQLAKQMLYALEIYASNCYDTTQKHIANVNKLQSIEDINNYNFKTDYPEKLRF